MFRVGQSFKFKDQGTITYTVIKVYNDGAIEARDEEGDKYTFETSEFNELVRV
jgi:hypothetical protein